VYFAVTVLGFSFWFVLAVPFASHRETYWWLTVVSSEGFSYALSFIASTYRPLHQVTTWIAFQALDASVFPTSVSRQALLQFIVYGMFVLGWWLMFYRTAHRRALAVVGCVAGGVFFSGYVQLFHIYGLSYVPVILMLGALLHSWATGTVRQYEIAFAAIATVLVLWHPFATALFVGFYAGHAVETFGQRDTKARIRSLVITVLGVATVGFFVFVLPRLFPESAAFLVETATRPVGTRLFGFLVSYRTNEVHHIASFVAFLLAMSVAVTFPASSRSRLVAVSLATALGALFAWLGIPLVLLWILFVMVKLAVMRCWPLLCLALTTAVLPFGGGIGTPIHALFAIVVATYVTALAIREIESTLSGLRPRHVAGLVLLPVAVALIVSRAGFDMPLLTRFALPLLAERERTYQLEDALSWLRQSKYCGHSIAFAERADNPIDSVESAITREYRPPSSISDVGLFWNTVLRCTDQARRDRPGTAIVTFGGPAVAGADRVFELPGRYAGPATVWIALENR
jgi:hypothetical protein